MALGITLLPVHGQATELTTECGGEFTREGVCELLFNGFPLTVEGSFEADSNDEWVDIHVEMVFRAGPIHIAPYLECEEEAVGRIECHAEYGLDAELLPVPSVPGVYGVTCWAHTHTRASGDGWFRCSSGH